MMNKQEFTNIAKRILHSEQGMRSPQLMHPQREWTTGLLVAVLLFVGTTVWSVDTYLQYRDITISEQVASQSEVTVYREAMVGSVLQTFSDRAVEHEALIAQMRARLATAADTASTTDAVEESEMASQASSTAPTTEGETASSTTDTEVEEDGDVPVAE